MKKFLAIFLATVMVLSLGTVVAMADLTETTVYMHGTYLPVGKYLPSGSFTPVDEAPTDSGYAYMRSDTELVLNNYNYSNSSLTNIGISIYALSDFTIKLIGKNQITLGEKYGIAFYSEQTNGRLTIEGPGGLGIIADNLCICMVDNATQYPLTIKDCELSFDTYNSQNFYYAIYCPKDLKILNSYVTSFTGGGICTDENATIFIKDSDVYLESNCPLSLATNTSLTIKNSIFIAVAELFFDIENINPITLEYDNGYQMFVSESEAEFAIDITDLSPEEQFARYKNSENKLIQITAKPVEDDEPTFTIISRGEPTKGYKEGEAEEYATPLPDTRMSTAPATETEANPNTGLALSIAPLALLAFLFKKRK